MKWYCPCVSASRRSISDAYSELSPPTLSPAAPPIYRYTEIFAFLDAVDLCGKSIATKVQDHPDRRLFLPLARSSPPRSSHPQVQDHPDRPVDTEKCNVSFEARLIKKMYIRLQHA